MRVGAIILPNHELADSIAKAHFALAMSAPVLAQEIIYEMLEYDDVENWISNLRNKIFNNMLKIRNKLHNTKLLIEETQGGIFAWIDISKLNVSATNFSNFLMYKSKVMVSPESIFNSNRDSHIRINLSVKWDHLEFAIDEIINVANLITTIKRNNKG